MQDSNGYVIGVVVARGYGATSYITGYGQRFERVASRAPDASGQRPISDFLELQEALPSDVDQDQLTLFQVKRFGGFSSTERAEQELRRIGVKKVVKTAT